MGSLTFPTGGSVYIDANAIIYSVERIEPYRELLAPDVARSQSGPVHTRQQRTRRIGNANQTPAGSQCSP